VAELGAGTGGGGTDNGRTFVFVSDRDGNLEIYRSRFDGTLQTRLTTEPAADLNPSLNRAGTALVFSSERGGNREIYKLTLATNTLQRFTEDPNPGVQDRSPVFSPDGSLIAWVSSRGGVPNVFVMDATGANQRQITTVTTELATAT
jgi:TolB protein